MVMAVCLFVCSVARSYVSASFVRWHFIVCYSLDYFFLYVKTRPISSTDLFGSIDISLLFDWMADDLAILMS